MNRSYLFFKWSYAVLTCQGCAPFRIKFRMAYKEELRNQDTELEFETGSRISPVFF